MKYKLLSNGTGVLITRQPEVVSDSLYIISFQNAEEGSTAIITCQDESYYLPIVNGKCSIDRKKLSGEMKVSVALFNESVHAPKWICEELKTEKLGDGTVLVCPNDMNLPAVVIRLLEEFDNLLSKFSQLSKKCDNLAIRLNSIMESYDLF